VAQDISLSCRTQQGVLTPTAAAGRFLLLLLLLLLG
jgi:hypothetical protein